jgi:hypothetical protein
MIDIVSFNYWVVGIFASYNLHEPWFVMQLSYKKDFDLIRYIIYDLLGRIPNGASIWPNYSLYHWRKTLLSIHTNAQKKEINFWGPGIVTHTVIPAKWEGEIEGLCFEDSLGKKLVSAPFSTNEMGIVVHFCSQLHRSHKLEDYGVQGQPWKKYKTLFSPKKYLKAKREGLGAWLHCQNSCPASTRSWIQVSVILVFKN